jgi:hypothetical protein
MKQIDIKIIQLEKNEYLRLIGYFQENLLKLKLKMGFLTPFFYDI